MRPQRILVTTNTIGGVWIYALELSRILTESSVQVILATMGRPLTPTQRRWADRVPKLILQESSYKLE
jgi:glycogen(starch) synthase